MKYPFLSISLRIIIGKRGYQIMSALIEKTATDIILKSIHKNRSAHFAILRLKGTFTCRWVTTTTILSIPHNWCFLNTCSCNQTRPTLLFNYHESPTTIEHAPSSTFPAISPDTPTTSFALRPISIITALTSSSST